MRKRVEASRIRLRGAGRASGLVLLMLLAGVGVTRAQTAGYLGFDRNEYPGATNLAKFRKWFAFTGYWLNPPPGMQSNQWVGKRREVREANLGFLILWNGKLEREIKKAGNAKALGEHEGTAAAAAAAREGFPRGAAVFLDQEEGGRLTEPQRDFLLAWVDALQRGGYRAGVYCSGIAFRESPGSTIRTDEDIRAHAGGREIVFFLYNDQCGPSPGCRVDLSLRPQTAGADAEVWQYAQSPRRPEYTASCASTYAPDGNCYVPPFGPADETHVDIEVATSPDPSHGR